MRLIIDAGFDKSVVVSAVGAVFMFTTFFLSLALFGEFPETPHEDSKKVPKSQHPALN